MSRLIDADKLIEEIESYRGDIFASEIVDLIKQFQTADTPDANAGEWKQCRSARNDADRCKVGVSMRWKAWQQRLSLQIELLKSLLRVTMSAGKHRGSVVPLAGYIITQVIADYGLACLHGR